jgi:probable addiction module antidote protein
MKPETTPYDPADFLDDEEAIAEYLRLTCEDGGPVEIARALGAVARARGMTEIAQKTGLTRQALYKALGEDGNPELATITKVAAALGFRLTFVPAGGASPGEQAA